ncbi:hypothetical protein P3T31_004844, partial [Rhizobium sp. AN70]|nr:hypothetical protein [Rhizobium sp. AN70]
MEVHAARVVRLRRQTAKTAWAATKKGDPKTALSYSRDRT